MKHERYSKNFNDSCRCQLCVYSCCMAGYDCNFEYCMAWRNYLMNFKKNRHYTNEYGVELNEYLKHNFNYEELAGWYTMQVLKYLVRAGKKEGESYDKDHNKALDYAKELANLSNENKLTYYTTDDIMGFAQDIADDFKQWKGEEDELFYICIPEPDDVNGWLGKGGGLEFFSDFPKGKRYKWTQEEIDKHEVAKHLEYFKKKVEK